MKRPYFLLALAAATLVSSAKEEKINIPGFQYEKLYSGNGMTALDFDSAGRMFVCEKQGRVLVFNPDKKARSRRRRCSPISTTR